jgi:hypothetical protein
MRTVHLLPLHGAASEWQRREHYHWLTEVFDAPFLRVEAGCTPSIRAHVREQLSNAGWEYKSRIDSGADLWVTGRCRDMALQVQTGNMSRAIYDLVKLQYLYSQGMIEVAALAVPMKAAADRIASNVANCERIWSELVLFEQIFTVPLLLIGFE